MTQTWKTPGAALLLSAAAAAASAAPLMNAEWAAAACEQCNQTPTLLDGLGDGGACPVK